MQSVNKVILVGRVGQDPQTNQTKAGKAVTSFSLATSQKSQAGETTQWFKVICWDKLGEIAAQYVTKGAPLYIEGRVEMREYTDRQGNVKNSLEVTARDLVLLGSKPRESASPMDQEDVPF
jgi:single-strand DNA-binding protein